MSSAHFLLRRLSALLLLSPAFAHAMTPHHLYIGTYTRDGGKGIYALTVDPATGALINGDVQAHMIVLRTARQKISSLASSA